MSLKDMKLILVCLCLAMAMLPCWRGRDQASQPKLLLCRGLHIYIDPDQSFCVNICILG